MSSFVRLPLVQMIVVAIVTMLAAGRGLGGLVRTLAPDVHVCTCASGGSHAHCPVCNPFGARSRSLHEALDGLPCGERHGAVAPGDEPALALSAPAEDLRPFVRAGAPCGVPTARIVVAPPPPTPPPRFADV